MSGTGGWITCVCLVMCLCGTRGEKRSDECDSDMVFLNGDHDGRKNSTTIWLKTYSTTAVAFIVNGSLVPSYPWMNISDAEPELILARSQLKSLRGLVKAFPNASFISLTYEFDDRSQLIDIWVDRDSVSFDVNASSPSTGRGGTLSMTAVKPYAGQREFDAFLRSRSAVLRRWREICREAFDRDVREGVNMTHVYYPKNATLECSVRLWIPVYYWLDFECSEIVTSIPRVLKVHDDRRGETITWKNTPCNAAAVKCVFSSYADWKKEISPVVVVDPVVVVAERSSGNETEVIVPIVVVALALALGLLAYGYYRYRSSARSERGCLCGYVRVTRR